MILRFRLLERGLLLTILPLIGQVACIVWLAVQLWTLQTYLLRDFSSSRIGSAVHLLCISTLRDIYALQMGANSKGMLDRDDAQAATKSFRARINSLEDLTRSDRLQKENIDRLRSAAHGLTAVLNWTLSEQERGEQHWVNVKGLCSSNLLRSTKEFFSAGSAILVVENAKRSDAAAHVQRLRQQIKMMLWLALPGSFILTALLYYFYVLSIQSPVLRLCQNSRLLSQRKALPPSMSGTDELSVLDAVLHRVAESIAEAEKKDSMMVENAADMICSLSGDLEILSVNPQCSKLLNLSADQLIGNSFLDYVTTDDVARANALLIESRRLPEATLLELKLLRADNTIAETRCSIFWSAVQQSFFCVVHDATEENNIEKLKEDFMNMISHDLKSPLTSMLGSTSPILEGALGPVPEQILKEVQNANRNIVRLVSFVNQLLDFQKLRAGKILLQLSSVALSQMAEQATELVRSVADLKEMKIRIPSNLSEITLFCDQQLVGQVLLNFLSNAIKFAPQGSEVLIDAIERENDIEVTVTDGGSGVPESLRAKIFLAFEQVPTNRSKQGTGLGLAICKMIIDAHHGEVGCRSVAHSDDAAKNLSGSVFWFRLPKQTACQE